MLPLVAALGLMGLNIAGGAAGDWYRRRESADASGSVGDLLGQAPGLMYPGGGDQQGPPEQTPGSGLMADPTDARRQLSFAQGIMALPPEQRQAAAQIFEPILARSQQQAGERARLGQQASQFQQGEAAVQSRFDEQMQNTRDEFAENSRRYGETWALEKQKRDQDLVHGRQEIELNRLKLIDAANKNPNADALGPVPSGSARVMTPEGPVNVPLRGTEPWLKEYQARQGLVGAYQNIDELDRLVEKHGTEAYGANEAEMKFRYGRVLSSLASLESSGHTRYSKEQINELRDQIGDPTGWGSSVKSNAKLRAGYKALKNYIEEEYKQQGGRTQGWQGFGVPLKSLAAGQELGDRAARGQPRPPPGTVPYSARG